MPNPKYTHTFSAGVRNCEIFAKAVNFGKSQRQGPKSTIFWHHQISKAALEIVLQLLESLSKQRFRQNGGKPEVILQPANYCA